MFLFHFDSCFRSTKRKILGKEKFSSTLVLLGTRVQSISDHNKVVINREFQTMKYIGKKARFSLLHQFVVFLYRTALKILR